jgi:hypothetical protein
MNISHCWFDTSYIYLAILKEASENGKEGI